MCRGQIYMVWRSLIENVTPKDDVKYKRLLVFTDDVKNYNNKVCLDNQIHKSNENTTPVPDQLALWRQHEDLKMKLSSAEEQVAKARRDVHQLMDKISCKLSQRNLAKRHRNDAQRRLHLLQQVSEELQTKKSNLQETVSIANSLCYIENEYDAESKLDKCMGLVRRGAGRGASTASTSPPFNMNSMSMSSTVSTNSSSVDHDTDEHIVSLAKCGGDNLWPLLCERRAALCTALMMNNLKQDVKRNDRMTPESVLSHTYALHCSIALEATKCKHHIAHTKNRLAGVIDNFNMYPTDDACEYLVVCCERIGAQARVNALKSLMDELEHRRGIFEADGRHVVERHAAKRMIINMDKAILSKKDDLKRVMTSLQMTEKKIDNISECLRAVFTSLKDHEKLNDVAQYGDQMYHSLQSISKLRQFYDEKREKIKNKVNLSLEFEVSDNSYLNYTDEGSPRFIDELKLYLNKFNLEKNRKLVLESGEKIWIFETIQSSLERLYGKWQDDNVVSSLLCPSVNIYMNFKQLIDIIHEKMELSSIFNEMEDITEISKEEKRSADIIKKRLNESLLLLKDISRTLNVGFENLEFWSKNEYITELSKEEKRSADIIKKRLNESLLLLKDISRTLNVGFENLEFWSKNECKKYISTNRYVDGKTYREYEKCYLDYMNI
ncbi:hypothetical protein K1T71_012995 [Dendrolimus kikuchii]|uniref:Uncharacterized protein n=1 Tax=Dendrolimus kikuchii TaxID=765133 RepID=A0ACC1CIT5_9NEOP|nr:hypothetical protein K1T71_012995 [Dendrolimus kikuchii]